MSKIYVVQARNYEYDDERYESTEGGNVVRAYTSLAAAETDRIQRTMNSLRDGGMSLLIERYDIFTDEALEVLEKHELQPSGHYLDYYEAEDISDAIKSGQITEDELRILARGIERGHELFFIEEVEVD